MLCHSPRCSALPSELSCCLFVVFSGLCDSGLVFIPDSFKRGLSAVSTLVTVALDKVTGLLVFVRAMLATKLKIKMLIVKFIRFIQPLRQGTGFRNTPGSHLVGSPLKPLTVAFSNEYPPHSSGFK